MSNNRRDDAFDNAHYESEEDPDIAELFDYYNDIYFESMLGGNVKVEWSDRMVSKAAASQRTSSGGVVIKLSEQILGLRNLVDTERTLLHHMIHAFCMTQPSSFLEDSDTSGGHGSVFRKLMKDINSSNVYDKFRPRGGYKITLTHQKFAEEADVFKEHRWKCNRCGQEIHRATNRKPSANDCPSKGVQNGHYQCKDYRCTWHKHLRKCGGEWIKIHEPEGYVDKRRKKFSGQGATTGWDESGWDTVPDSPTTLPAINTVLQQRAHTGAAPSSAEERRALMAAAALRRAGQGHTEPTLITPEQRRQLQKQPQKRQIEVINLAEDDDDEHETSPGGARGAGAAPVAKRAKPLAAGLLLRSCPLCNGKFADNNNAMNDHLNMCPVLKKNSE